MGGPQIPAAIAVSKAVRAASPKTPILWGGYFATLCATQSVTAPYVDYVVRGQGEQTLIELLQSIFNGDAARLKSIEGLSWLDQGTPVHNKDRAFSTARPLEPRSYAKLANPRIYLGKTFLGRQTAVHQAAFGCRFRCTFCGVASMFRGKTSLPDAERLDRDLTFLGQELGADSIHYYDHNFFDREVEMVPLLEVMAKHQLPWWCFARSDALVNLSDRSWSLVRKSRLRMAYIGAESPNDTLLHDIRKGTRSDQTLQVVEKCRANGVIPELSFMLAPPEDPEGETERTFEFIRAVKRLHPATEIMLYIYTPLPPSLHAPPPRRGPKTELKDVHGNPVVYPATADEWAQPHWVDYWCPPDAPWLSERLRRRILDFTTVLGCRFPTITDVRSPSWAKTALSALAAWRYRYAKYSRPVELDLSKKVVRLWDPRVSGL
jgi:radical SAM superfamily enzyme YgiQ (UPF0313 family)